MLALKLLGGARVETDQGRVAGRSVQRHQIALMALLATAPGYTLSRDKLIGLLWPERDTKHARNLLNVSMYAIRRLLSVDALLSEKDGIELNIARWRVDVMEFDAALSAAELERATRLYTGPFLDGFFLAEAPEFERWQSAERDRLARRYARTLQTLANDAERSGDTTTAIDWWHRLAAHDPLDSHAALGLMRALARSGNRAAAIQHWRSHTALLSKELGVGPSSDVVAIATTLAADTTETSGVGSEPSPTSRPAADVRPRSSDHHPLPPKRSTAEFDHVPPRGRSASLMRKLALLAGAGVVVLGASLMMLRAGREATGHASPVYRHTAIAVLPFQNLSVEPPHAYFASGLHDELLTQLSKVAGLSVTSRQSVMGYAGKNPSPLKQIASELEVGSVVEGSVQVVGNRLRVTVQLIDASTDDHLWGERYDRTLDDAFAIQSDIARQIVVAIGTALSDAETRALAAPHTTNAEAYRLYLQGRDYFTRDDVTQQNLDIAQQFYERALTLDPRFALAHAALSEVHGRMYIVRWDRSPARATRQREAAEAALRLAPNLPQAHLAMGSWHYHARGDYPRALAELRLAAKGLPSDTEVWGRIGHVTRRMGNWNESIAAHEKTTQLNPRSALLFKELGWTYLFAQRYSEAITAFDRAWSLAPDISYPRLVKGLAYVRWQGQLDTLRAVLKSRDWSPTAGDWTSSALDLMHWDRRADSMLQIAGTARTGVFEGQNFFLPASLYAAWAHQLRGDRLAARVAFDSARVFLDSAIKEHPDDERMHAALGLALAGLGRHEDALREARWLQQSVPYREDKAHGGLVVENRARILAQVGDAEAALDEIESLLARPSQLTVHTLRLDPHWDPIRTHARFRALVATHAAR